MKPTTAAKPEPSVEIQTCESCDNEFGCGAKTGNCWCFHLNVDEDALARIKEEFKNCLCPDCLRNMNSPE